jgi:electron transport complex protein RnfD
MGGSLGEVSAIALLIGGIYLVWKKIIPIHIPLAIFGSIAIFTGILNLAHPDLYAGPAFHLLTGGVMLGAIYMATDMVTSPMVPKGMWIYGIGIGVITVLIRVWGVYPEGMSFAILIMNAFVPLINKTIKPKMFGEVKKTK